MNRIGRYELQVQLGRGGFGQVFRAYDPTVGRLVAIKTLTATGEPEMLTRFRNEAAAAGKLRHQNIVVIHDFGEHEGAPYLVMELLEGEDLERTIVNQRPLTLLQKLDIMTKVAAGLHHAHTKGIVHRDVKPANIMLLPDSSVKIMDFGIALLTQATAARITPQGSLIGTLPYMAPEQFYGTASDSLTDIFAYGVTCYKLLTGEHPFQAVGMAELMFNIMNKAPAPLRTLSPDCPEALEEAMLKLLAKDRDARYQTLEDVRFDLEPIILELRRESAGSLVAEARRLIAGDQLEQAQAVVRQALEIEPGERTARELRETLQRQLREKAVRPRIAALVTGGREQLEARQFDQAIQQFESALRLDKSNPELHLLIQQARTAWERAQRADRLVQEAAQALQRDDLSGAHKSVAEALSLDPHHAAAAELAETVRARIEAHEREQKLRDEISQVKGLMLLQSFDEAIVALTRLRQEFPEAEEASSLLDRARREQAEQKRKRRLQAETEAIKELLRNRRLADAVDRLSGLRAEFPEAAELRELATYAAAELQAERQAEVLARASAEARELTAAARFEEAIARLQQALDENPGLGALRELMQNVAAAQAEHRRKAALQEVLSRAKALASEERFAEAIEQIGAFVRAYGDDVALASLRKQNEEGLERQRRSAAVRKMVLEARQLLDDDRPGTATQLLQRGTIQFPGDRDLTALLGQAREKLKEQQQSEAISKTIGEAESLARARQFDRALELLDACLLQYPGSERLFRCREATLASRTAFEKEQIRRETLGRIGELHAAGDYEAALRAIEEAPPSLAGEHGLTEWRQRIASEVAEQKRIQGIREALAQAQASLDQGDAMSATQILRGATRLYPQEEQVAAMMAAAEARLQEQRKTESVGQALRDARALLDAKRFDEAIGLLDAALAENGQEDSLLRARKVVVAEKTAHERQHALNEARAAAHAMYQAGRLEEAQRAIRSAAERFGADPEMQALEARVRDDLEARRRENERAGIVRQANDHLARNDALSATRILRQGVDRFAGDPEITRLYGQANASLEQQERERAIATLADNARTAIRTGRLAEALTLLEQGLGRFPNEEALVRLRDSVKADLAREEAVQRARRLLGERRFDQALKELAPFVQTEPANPALLELKRKIEAGREEEIRAADTRKAIADARGLIAKDRLEQADAALRDTPRANPGHAEIADLHRTTTAELARRRQEQQVEEVRRQAEALLSQDKPEQAAALIQDRFPSEARLQELLSRARREQEARRRQSVIRQAQDLGQQERFEQALQLLARESAEHGGSDDIAALRQTLERALEQQRLRQARERDRERLAALEPQASPSLRKGKLQKLRTEIEEIRSRHAGDPEIQSAAAALLARLEPPPATTPPPPKPRETHEPPKPRKPLPWKQIGIATAAALATITLIVLIARWTKPAPPVIKPVMVEIQTDPPGASVQVGTNSCTANCQMSLMPGEYQIHAQLDKYLPGDRTFTVRAAETTPRVTVVLQPEPMKPVDTKAAIGTLMIRAGVSGALVLVDNRPAGRTDPRGEFSTTLEAKAYEVRVEKNNYQTPPEQRVTIASGGSQVVPFTLLPKPGTLELRNAPAGVEVRANDRLLGRTDGSAVFARELTPGKQALRMTYQAKNVQASVDIGPGQRSAIDWRTIAPAAPPPPAESPETVAWEQARNSNDPSVVQAFVNRFPGGAHTGDANKRLEGLVWDQTNQGNSQSLRSYLSRFPSGDHAREARARISELAWNLVNKEDIQALRGFAEQNGDSPLAGQAKTLADQLERQKAKLEEGAKKQPVQPVPQPPSLDQVNRQQILALLGQFNNASRDGDRDRIRTIWNNPPGSIIDAVHTTYELTPLENPAIKGDQATVLCKLITNITQPRKTMETRNLVDFRNRGGAWVIVALRPAR